MFTIVNGDGRRDGHMALTLIEDVHKTRWTMRPTCVIMEASLCLK